MTIHIEDVDCWHPSISPLPVHVIVRADVEKDDVDGVEDKNDAVLAREPRREALGERSLDLRRCVRSEEARGSLAMSSMADFVSAVSSGWRWMKAVSRLSNLPVVKISLKPT